MTAGQLLPASFYQRDVVEVARALLGKRLVRRLDGTRLSGYIIEAEAYRGEEDLACHARVGRTERTAVMYGPPGRAYVYFTYGMHWMLNCVCMEEGYPAAVLLRAIKIDEGREAIGSRRGGQPEARWCDGPAKLTQGLGIDKRLNGAALDNQGSGLWIEEGVEITDRNINATARIGLGNTPEPWLSMPWRFLTFLPDLK
ncbi:MAG TPA: DNA-3-methyladenine glycosylase [Longilinea sp.]|nr:DNA-3-methyladenine glycosylase [Longilinea sp.]